MKVTKHERELLIYLVRNDGKIKSAYVLTRLPQPDKKNPGSTKRTGNASRYLAAIKKFCKAGHLKETPDGYVADDEAMRFINALKKYGVLDNENYLEEMIDMLFPSRKPTLKAQQAKREAIIEKHINEGVFEKTLSEGYFGSEDEKLVVNGQLAEKAEKLIESNVKRR